MTPVLAEFIGTAVMLLLGTGVCANVSLGPHQRQRRGVDRRHRHLGDGRLHRSGDRRSVQRRTPQSFGHAGLRRDGQFPWSDVPGYVLAQMLGGAAGALATWLFYRPHFDLEESPDTIRGVFCTAPAVRNPASNLLSEIIATFVLIFTIFYITEGHLASTEGNVPIGLGSVGALPVALVILVIGGRIGRHDGLFAQPCPRPFAAHRPRAGPDPPQGRQRLALCVDRLGRTAARGAARRRSSSDDPLLETRKAGIEIPAFVFERAGIPQA